MSDNSILECPSCGARLKVKAASLRALKEVKCAKCRAPIPTSSASSSPAAAPAPAPVAAPAPAPVAPSASIPDILKPDPSVIKIAPAAVSPVAKVATPAAAPAAAPVPVGVVADAPASSAAPVPDLALTQRVAALEARLAEQDNLIVGLRQELARLRDASAAAARQWASGLESA